MSKNSPHLQVATKGPVKSAGLGRQFGVLSSGPSQRLPNVPAKGGRGRAIMIMRALSSLRGLRGAPEVPPLCRET